MPCYTAYGLLRKRKGRPEAALSRNDGMPQAYTKAPRLLGAAARGIMIRARAMCLGSGA
jgi:hypothetical protein